MKSRNPVFFCFSVVAFAILFFGCTESPNTEPVDKEPDSGSNSGVPVVTAAGLTFTDNNPDSDFVQGTITIQPAEDESQIQTYHLYWADDSTGKIGTMIASLPKSPDPLTYTFSSSTEIPGGASQFLVITANAEGEMSHGITCFINRIQLSRFDFQMTINHDLRGLYEGTDLRDVSQKLFYALWISADTDNNGTDDYFQTIFKGASRPGTSSSNTFLPYWSVATDNNRNSVTQEVDVITGATVNRDQFQLSGSTGSSNSSFYQKLKDESLRQFTVYLEVDIPDDDFGKIQNPNDWFIGQPAVLFRAEVDLDNLTSLRIPLVPYGWTAGDPANEKLKNIPHPNVQIDGFVQGELNTELRYITHKRNGQDGSFGSEYDYPLANTKMIMDPMFIIYTE